MASELRSEVNAVVELQHSAKNYSFFQLTRILKRQPISGRCALSLNFNAALNFAHQTHEINALVAVADNIYNVVVNFIGILGLSGALPELYTELALQRQTQKDTGLVHFISIFESRLIHIFYEIWQRNQFYVSYLQSMSYNISNRGLHLAAALSDSDNIKTLTKEATFFYSGLFSYKSRPREGLRILLRHYFNLPIQVYNFTGNWLAIEKSQRTHLVQHQQQGFNRLGQSAILGKRVWHTQDSFTVHIGPMNDYLFNSLLPNTGKMQVIINLIKDYVDSFLNVVIILEHEKATIKPAKLVRNQPLYLGWNAWLLKNNRKNLQSRVKFDCDKKQEFSVTKNSL